MARGNFIDPEFEKELVSDDEHDIPNDDHEKLLEAVGSMDGHLRIKPPTRTELTFNVSEFDLAPIKGGNVHLKDLANTLYTKGKTFEAKVAKNVHWLTRRSTTLQKPLEKHQLQKIKRVVAYDNLTKHVARWDAAIQTNRAARTITFPMNIEPVVVSNPSEVSAMWQSQTQTDFEAGLNALHGMSKVYQEDKKVEEKFRLTFEELRQKRQEMAKLRAQHSFEAAKAHKRNKIKSKSYHRILRREKMQKQLKEFEALQKTDPEAALKRLEELERVRAEERMTLRHKNTGHWARSRLIRAKYDTQTRRELAEQLAVSRDLTKKQKANDSSDDEQTGDTKEPGKAIPGDEDNPWITVKSSAEINDFVSGYRKYWDKLHKQAEAAKENTKGEERDKDERMKNGEDNTMENSNISEEINEVSKKQISEDMDECEDTIHPEAEAGSTVKLNSREDPANDTLPIRLHEKESQNKKEQETDSVTHRENQNDEYEECKKIQVSMDASDRMVTTTDQLRKVSSAKLKKKRDRKLKCKKTSKSLLVSTNQSWIVSPIAATEDHASPENQMTEDHASLENQMTEEHASPENQMTEDYALLKNQMTGTSSKNWPIDSRVVTFLASVIPDVLDKEEKKKKKKKSALDRMFDEVENKISSKFLDKFKKLASQFNSENGLGALPGCAEDQMQEDDLGASLALKNMRDVRPIEDTELLEGSLGESSAADGVTKLAKAASGINTSQTSTDVSSRGTSGAVNTPEGTNATPAATNINPEKFIAAKPKVLLTPAPEFTCTGEEALDNEMEERQQIISEAFADDDIVDNFRKEKQASIKTFQRGKFDLTLPGWGDWGGLGIAQRKKKRFFCKPPPAPPRRDANKSNIIINEDETEGIRRLQVCELPQPFKSVKDFEASIRAPIGSTWIPETAHRRFITPAVVTKIGTVIKPMDEEFLVNKKTLLDFSH